MSKSSMEKAVADVAGDEQIHPEAAPNVVVYLERGARGEGVLDEASHQTTVELRAELRERAVARASFLIDDTEKSWLAYKADLAAKKTEAKRLAIGVDAAEAQLAAAATKKDAASAAHASATTAVVDAQQKAADAEARCVSEGEAAWPDYKSARDTVQMREHLHRIAERALDAAQTEHNAALAVAERERKSAKMAEWALRFDEAIRSGSAAMSQLLAALSVASGLMNHDGTEFHVRRWARGVQDQMRRSHPQHQLSPGVTSDIDLLRAVLGDLA